MCSEFDTISSRKRRGFVHWGWTYQGLPLDTHRISRRIYKTVHCFWFFLHLRNSLVCREQMSGVGHAVRMTDCFLKCPPPRRKISTHSTWTFFLLFPTTPPSLYSAFRSFYSSPQPLPRFSKHSVIPSSTLGGKAGGFGFCRWDVYKVSKFSPTSSSGIHYTCVLKTLSVALSHFPK